MTLLEVREIFDYWRESPPVHLAFKSFLQGLGGKPKPGWREALGDPRTAERPAPAETLDELRQVRGLAVGKGGNVHAGLSHAPVLDLAEMRARAERVKRRLSGAG